MRGERQCFLERERELDLFSCYENKKIQETRILLIIAVIKKRENI